MEVGVIRETFNVPLSQLCNLDMTEKVIFLLFVVNDSQK